MKKGLLNKQLPIYLFVFVLICDALSKYFVYHEISPIEETLYVYPYNGIGLFKNFIGIEGSIVYAKNYGAAWSLFSGFQVPLLIVRALLIASIGIYMFFFNKKEWMILPLSLIFAGAIGNFLDFFFYGHVIDFIHVVLWGWDYPVFNVADSAIFIGVLWLLIRSFWD